MFELLYTCLYVFACIDVRVHVWPPSAALAALPPLQCGPTLPCNLSQPDARPPRRRAANPLCAAGRVATEVAAARPGVQRRAAQAYRIWVGPGWQHRPPGCQRHQHVRRRRLGLLAARAGGSLGTPIGVRTVLDVAAQPSAPAAMLIHPLRTACLGSFRAHPCAPPHTPTPTPRMPAGQPAAHHRKRERLRNRADGRLPHIRHKGAPGSVFAAAPPRGGTAPLLTRGCWGVAARPRRGGLPHLC